MRKHLQEALSEEFPFMQRGLSDRYYDIHGMDDIGEGWYKLIRDMCEEITALYETEGRTVDIVVEQVQARFGQLCFFYSFKDQSAMIRPSSCPACGSSQGTRPEVPDLHEKVPSIVGEYEQKSTHICEACGRPGSPRVDLKRVMTLCDEHYQYYAVKEERMRYLHDFLNAFRYDTPIRLLDEKGHVLYENTVGEITQRNMDQRIVLSAYVERDRLIVTTALDEA